MAHQVRQLQAILGRIGGGWQFDVFSAGGVQDKTHHGRSPKSVKYMVEVQPRVITRQLPRSLGAMLPLQLASSPHMFVLGMLLPFLRVGGKLSHQKALWDGMRDKS